jgi:hypothetical protein
MGLLNCQHNIKRAQTQIKRKEIEDGYFLHPERASTLFITSHPYKRASFSEMALHL